MLYWAVPPLLIEYQSNKSSPPPEKGKGAKYKIQSIRSQEKLLLLCAELVAS